MRTPLARFAAVAASLLLHGGAALLLVLLVRDSPPAVLARVAQAVEIGVHYLEPAAAPAETPVEPPRAPPRATRRAHGQVESPMPSAPSAPASGAAPGAPMAADSTGALAVPATEGDGDGAAPAGPIGSGDEDGVGIGAGSGIDLGASDDDLFARISRRITDQAAGCYPPALARLRAKGVVHLRFSVGSDGRPREASVAKSSGVALFDDAALGCVLERAAPLPPTRDFVLVPILFRPRH